MKPLDLQKSIETFAVFDFLMLILALLGLFLAMPGLLFGGVWLYVTILMILGEFILAYGIWIAPRRLSVSRYRESIGESPSVWLKIAFISDFHFRPQKSTKWAQKIANKLKEEKPDLLLMGGDYVVHDAHDVCNMESLAGITATYGAYFVLGNHDYQDDPKAITAKLKSFGFHDLNNSCLSLNVQGKQIGLCGLDDGYYGVPVLPLKRLDSAPHITLMHEPDLIMDIKEGDTDLVFCGHAHGGQIRFPLIGSLHVPSVFGRKADVGKKVIKGIPTIISRGLGEVGVRARLFAPPEIVIVELGV